MPLNLQKNLPAIERTHLRDGLVAGFGTGYPPVARGGVEPDAAEDHNRDRPDPSAE